MYVKNRSEQHRAALANPHISSSIVLVCASCACIAAFLKGDTKPLFNNLKKLSHLVFENFSPMIPHSMKELWQQGIETNAYYLKLCGSGGGGFVLGFTPDYDQAKTLLKGYETELIYRL